MAKYILILLVFTSLKVWSSETNLITLSYYGPQDLSIIGLKFIHSKKEIGAYSRVGKEGDDGRLFRYTHYVSDTAVWERLLSAMEPSHLESFKNDFSQPTEGSALLSLGAGNTKRSYYLNEERYMFWLHDVIKALRADETSFSKEMIISLMVFTAYYMDASPEKSSVFLR